MEGVKIPCSLRLFNTALLTAHVHGEETLRAPAPSWGQASCLGHCTHSKEYYHSSNCPPLSDDPSPVLSAVLPSAGLSQTSEKIRIIQRAEGCSLPQMVQAWIAVKELNLLQRLTSSTGAGEEQALRTQEKKNTQYGKMPTA